MDIPVIATALDSQKRPRDGNGSYISDESADQTPAVKRICGPSIEDLSISSILEKVSEANGLYEQNELDEVQEKLVCGVMKSLEEEISISGPASCILFPEGRVVDSTTLQTVSQETCIAEEFSLGIGDETSSTSCGGGLDSLELPSLLESIYSLNESSSALMAIGALVSGDIYGAIDGPAIVQSENHRFDIGYLLEASDDELGIAPSTSSRSFSSEADFISGKLPGTDSTSSNNDKSSLEPWQFEWDCSSENFYELAHDEYVSTDQEWLRSTISPHVYDLSLRMHASLDTSSTNLEGAGVID